MGTCTADAMALIGPRWCSIIVAILYNSLIQFLNESIFKSYAFAGASLAGLRPFYTRAPRLSGVPSKSHVVEVIKPRQLHV